METQQRRKKDFLNSVQMDVDDEETAEEQTKRDGDARTAPSTSTVSLSVPEAATDDSSNATIVDETLCPTTSARFSCRQPAQCQ
ncbi:hypothetical protein PoB_005196200 [Plakobranchus ocellatus]|uniref:Uncharacterized protein n=1 Tax=Plakobranchus ocellatus TaxID=259542 RepID=A0AAV4C2G7_9GAST|nr:hypothetical protein PoB_005196200 [Plakobranchus ocellatus]